MTTEEKLKYIEENHGWQYKMMIKHTLNSFDFERVKKVMEALEWKYSDINGVPDQYEICSTAKRICVDCIYDFFIKGCESEMHISTAGFDVAYYAPDDESEFGELQLKFVVEESNSEYWDEI